MFVPTGFLCAALASLNLRFSTQRSNTNEIALGRRTKKTAKRSILKSSGTDGRDDSADYDALFGSLTLPGTAVALVAGAYTRSLFSST